MVFEAFTPIEHIPVVGAGPAFHLGVALDGRLTVRPEFCSVRGRKDPMAGLLLAPVRPSYPAHSSGWMLVLCPLDELKKENMIACVEDRRCHRGLVIVYILVNKSIYDFSGANGCLRKGSPYFFGRILR